MIKALKELKRLNIAFNNNINEFILTNKTYIDNNKLYYKSIPEGLFLLVNNQFTDLKELNNSFESFGSMLDLSRGAVFKVSYIKELIYKHALLGLNEMWLYIEDIYPIETEPTFGYFRGKYIDSDLKEIVSYAKIFGITIVPAIQVLGHHGQFLRWPNSSKYKDMDQVLISNEETFSLIEKMLIWAKENFGIKKIHIGMDETFGLGFGNYYKKYSYKNPMDIFINHLNRVNKMAVNVGFSEVMIWSDMFFRFLSETEYYYDVNNKLTVDIINKIPENITLVYWDYYNWQDEIVKNMIINHLETKRKIVFASGTWIWTRFTYDKKQTDKTAKMHLQEANKANLKNFILTQWMDDGAYGNHITTLLGLYELSADLYTNFYNEDVYRFIVGSNYQDDLVLTKINNTTLSQVGLLWDDPILGIYLANFTGNNYKKFDIYINEQIKIINQFKDQNLKTLEYFVMKINLNKLILRKNILTEYSLKDLKKDNITIINQIIIDLKKLNEIYYNLWSKQYKAYGFEIIQSRLGTQIIRFKELIRLINNYKQGENIEIFDEKIVEEQFLSLKYNELAYSLKPF